ncbi:MAG: hypothetical protein CMJ77_14805 [Planctomycetaceae bacterium]|nr:hypothetical protein [Planctomycetaceae bacterium]
MKAPWLDLFGPISVVMGMHLNNGEILEPIDCSDTPGGARQFRQCESATGRNPFGGIGLRIKVGLS